MNMKTIIIIGLFYLAGCTNSRLQGNSSAVSNEEIRTMQQKNTTSILQTIKDAEIDCNVCLDASIYVRKHIDSLSIDDIFAFLLCFDNQCLNNVELVEFKNGLIFMLLNEKTILMLNTFDKYKRQIPWDNICKEITQPVNDGIDVKEIRKKIEAISGYDNVKRDVIKALDKAIIKSN